MVREAEVDESSDNPKDNQIPLLREQQNDDGNINVITSTQSSNNNNRNQTEGPSSRKSSSSRRQTMTQGGTFDDRRSGADGTPTNKESRLSSSKAGGGGDGQGGGEGSPASSFATVGLGFLDELDEATSAAMYHEMTLARRSIIYGAVKRSAVALLCTPFVGTILIGVGLQERKRRIVTMNPSDWQVLCWIGFCAQASLFAPLTNLISTDARDVLVNQLRADADFLGPFIVFGATSIYFVATVVGYIAFSTKQRIHSYERPRDAGVIYSARKLQRNKGNELLENIERIKLQIQEDTTLPTWIVLFLSTATGFGQMMSLRVCKWSELSNYDPTVCRDDILTFTAPGFNNIYYHIASTFWLLTFTALTGTIYLALMWYYQQLQHIEKFTYFTKGGGNSAGKGKTPSSPVNSSGGGSPVGSANYFGDASYGSISPGGSPPVSPRGSSAGSPTSSRIKKKQMEIAKDLFSPKHLSLWISVWKELLRDLRERPTMQAMTLTTVISCILCGTTTIIYVLFDNIYEGSAVAEFTPGCIAVFVFCCTAFGGFLFITVRLQYVVDYQVKGISETQTNVQRQLEAEMQHVGQQMESERKYASSMHVGVREADALRFKMLRAKVNVLQALDTVLRTSESKPKLLGMSLETIRWGIIIVGLVVMNVAFFVLYRSKCGG
ncbi:transmembrane protein, putative [Bodo saltans]|uniref:Transmembrane protein, putative n=1 Tax=Bodo saltans TaxID=75058 RepID=A0A0S4J101_BODSA|nr:transmembrane protein, putative [Bodo saltans]|eukprot:CUG78767.1 transmembrane protein, putative [Bodo saltans]